ncbi:hypothetical protein LCGC14_0481570 [marine sediment metagenome]|uniref:Uncharacterized protein n=1 Tax=marine sediment metagenome TaxID=412755 RepID=A0A0F9SSE0_9ZZZZ
MIAAEEPSEVTNWPEGVSDGLILPCAVCGNKVSFDYTVSDEAWDLVVSREQRLGVICLSCFDQIAASKGIDTVEHLKLVQFVGVNKTIGLRSIWEHDRD